MEVLDAYFKLFDESRYSEESFEQLNALFSDDIEFVLNKQSYHGKAAWIQFVKSVYKSNKDLKHMYNGWVQNEDGSYETKWAICGNRFETGVYTQEGMDIARLNADGKIIYLENKPNDVTFFSGQ
ncbi:nuclear transport factor 2 family protein [Mammaliicoccus sp. Dog046]|uniref:nuclear transport factor 2 family protein n=1 Tax=Mammaliicoccus sp. Dog046 TaxID=3034233 RepID=UPI002B25D1FC|nr:nuclear transport factor 2 family protein [Mammaliicoccus sp. Dog046]WQK85232.1 nuclear transport factor 2 family protein [Mammaliicoccus sp. Dog046]